MDNYIKNKWLRRLIVYLPEYIASIALLITLLSTGINVFTRYVLRFTFFWYTDITILAFAWMVFCGVAAAYRRHRHFGVDMLVNTFPEKFRVWFIVFMNIILTVIIILVAYSGYLLTKKVRGKQLPTILLSYKWYDASIVFGFGLMTIYSIIDIIKSIKHAISVCSGKTVSEENKNE